MQALRRSSVLRIVLVRCEPSFLQVCTAGQLVNSIGTHPMVRQKMIKKRLDAENARYLAAGRKDPPATPIDLKAAATRDIAEVVKAILADVFARDGHRDIATASVIEVWRETRPSPGPGSCPSRAARQMPPGIERPLRWREPPHRPSTGGQRRLL